MQNYVQFCFIKIEDLTNLQQILKLKVEIARFENRKPKSQSSTN